MKKKISVILLICMILQVCVSPFVEVSAIESDTYDVQSESTTDESTADESAAEDTPTEVLPQEGTTGDKDSDTLELQTDSTEGQTDMPESSESQTDSGDSEAETSTDEILYKNGPLRTTVTGAVSQSVRYSAGNIVLQANINEDKQSLTDTTVTTTAASSITGVKVYTIATDGTLGTELSASKYTVDADYTVTFLETITTAYAIVYTTSATSLSNECVVTANTASTQYIADSEDNFAPITAAASSSNQTIFSDFRIYYTDTGEEIVSGSSVPTENENITIEYTWDLSLADGVNAGDYFTFKIPDVFHIFNDVTGNLELADGTIVATFYIDANGDGIIIFNENASQSDSGTFMFNSVFDEDKTTGNIVIEVPVEGNDTVVIELEAGKNELAVTKSGAFNSKETGIVWTVDINETEEILSNAKVVDTRGGTTFTLLDTAGATATIYELVYDQYGNATQGAALIKDVDYTITFTAEATTINFIGEIDSAYRLVIESPIVRSVDTYTNSVTFSADDSVTVTDTASVSRSENHLAKKLINYDAATGLFTWEIRYNLDGKSIPEAEAYIIDTPSEDYEVNIGSVKVYKYVGLNSSLGAIISNENLVADDGSIYTVSIDLSDDSMTIQFLDDDDNGYVNGSYIIRYTTSYTGAPISDLTDSTITVTNGVDAGDDSEAEQVYSVSALTKGYSAVDYKERTITWNSTINAIRSNLTGLVYTDVFVTDGLALISGSVVVEDLVTNTNLVENVDYTIAYGTYTVNSSGSATVTGPGFEIIFSNSPSDHAYSVVYKTTWDVEALKASGKTSFVNGAHITDNTGAYVYKTSTVYPNEVFLNNGTKRGTYDYTTSPKTITWRVFANTYKQELTNPVITDVIPNSQLYNDEVDYKIYTVDFKANSSSSSSNYDATELTAGEYANVIFSCVPNEVDGCTTVTWTLKGDNGADLVTDKIYLIVFSTKVNGVVAGKFENTATLSSTGTTDTYTFTGSVSVANGDFFISKTGKQIEPNYIQWNIIANSNGSTLKNVVIKDELEISGATHYFVKDSFALYEGYIDSAGAAKYDDTLAPLVEGEDYTIEFSPSVGASYDTLMTISLIGDYATIYNPIVITYQTYCEKGSGVSVSNKASITADGITDKSNTETIPLNSTSASGNANRTPIDLTIAKVDMENSAIIKNDVTERAVFTLWNSAKDVELYNNISTDENGKITLSGLAYGYTYYLQEVTAPDAYLKLGEYIKITVAYTGGVTVITAVGEDTGKKYTVLADPDVATLQILNVTNNEYTNVTVSKTWVDGNNADSDRPSNITVKLLQDSSLYDTVMIKATEGWTYTFENLLKYDNDGNEHAYTIEEVALEGYGVRQTGYNITNTLLTEVSGVKTWVDSEDEDGVRPDSITVNLIQNDTQYATKTVTKNDNWMYTFEDLPKYNTDGNMYIYSIEELELKNYETEIDGYNITNTLIIAVSGIKTWVDDDNKKASRPTSITVNLLRDGVQMDSRIVSAADDWKYSFVELPKYDTDGRKYVYTIEEESVNGYKTTIDGYNITNTLTEETDTPETITGAPKSIMDTPETITDTSETITKTSETITTTSKTTATKKTSNANTGDDAMTWLFIMAAIISLAICTGVIAAKKGRSRAKKK